MTKVYKRLQDQIDFLIISFGSTEKVTEFIDSLFSTNKSREEKISSFINCAVAYYFELTLDELYNLEGRRRYASSCRVICYKLHQEYLQLSIRKIGKIYGRKENAVMRGIHSMNDIIEKPNIDITINKAFVHINNQVQKFITYYLDNGSERQKKEK